MPTFQTVADVGNEEATIQFLRDLWGCRLERMPDFHEFDYARIDCNGEIDALIEIKNRKENAAKYPTIMLSMTKKIAAKQWEDQGIKCYLVVRIGKGRPRILDINATKPYRIEWGGRHGRNHNEPLAHFSKSNFKALIEE